MATAANTNPNSTSLAVKAAQDLPALVDALKTVNPDLAEQIQGKGLVFSKTVLGHLIIGVVTLFLVKYGVNWDNAFQVQVLGALALSAQFVWGIVGRLITKSPITGIFSSSPVSTSSAPVATAGTAVLALIALSATACSTTQVGKVTSILGSAVAEGQLYCQTIGALEPTIVAVADAADSSAIIATGKTAAFVNAVCGVINAVPVSPPANPATAPVVSVKVPAA